MLEFALKKLRFINYLFIAIIVAAALLLTRNIINISFSKKEPHHIVTEGKSDNALLKKKNIMHYSAILEKNPFGNPMKLRPIAISKETGSQYGPMSDLILVGTAVGTENMSYAIFEDKSQSAPNKQEIFAHGEYVFNYGVLTKIKRTSVELERDSIIHTITIPFEDIKANRGRQEMQSTYTSKTSFAKKVSDREYILDSRQVQQSLENPEQILTDARLLPNIIDGRQEGFAISEVLPGGLYHSLGLRNGDTLLRINGLEISNPEVAIQAMSALRGMNRVNLDIIRNGKNMSMSYQIR